ncbi:hypothetical protein GCM10009117_25680 [Gangjinia marincola]|uniref:Uncharacterized protein n=1 Tax=Gangjinia marincola TaxID=578463 RepID=A0ABP3XVL8_9FLAO
MLPISKVIIGKVAKGVRYRIEIKRELLQVMPVGEGDFFTGLRQTKVQGLAIVVKPFAVLSGQSAGILISAFMLLYAVMQRFAVDRLKA